MRILIAIGILLFSIMQESTAQLKVATSLDSIREPKSLAFPQKFIGNWKGTINWYVTGKAVQVFTMRLRVQPTVSAGKYSWQIIYGDKQEDNRPYDLIAIDSLKGLWNIDEKNGIVLQNYLHGDALHGVFTIGDNTIINNYWIENEGLNVEFFTVKINDKTITGNGSEDSPNVSNYRIAGYQKGLLKREN